MRRLIFFPITFSLITILVSITLIGFQNFDLNFLVGYIFLNIIFYFLIRFYFILKVGRIIDNEGMGKYISRASMLQPIGITQLIKKDQIILTEKYSDIKIYQSIIKQCIWLMIIHPILAVLVIIN